MKLSVKSQAVAAFRFTIILASILFSGCSGEPDSTIPASTQVPATLEDAPSEVIIYVSELPIDALFELDLIDDPASLGGKSIGLPNTGDELDPPPENDPHVTFAVQVLSGIPYRCWIHMKVGAPKGKSQANIIWVQFSGAVDRDGRQVLQPGSASYLTAQGPTLAGWTWVGCNLEGTDSLIYFQSAGDVTVRLQAGAEGVAFDQFVLSSAEYLEKLPSEPVIEK